MAQIAGDGPLKMPLVRELDGIRGWSMSIIFFCHVGLGNVIPGGLMVTIFFFLSGFLITSLLRAEASTNGRVDIRQFFARRVLRIFPPLYLTLLTCGLFVFLGLLHERVGATGIVSQIFFFSNYAKWFGVEGFLPGPPLWSLAVEEHFYLLFPFLFSALIMRLSGKRAALLCLLICVFPLMFRIYHGVFGNVAQNYFLTHTRIDSILFGCVLALWHNPVLDKDAARPNLWLVALAAIMVLGSAIARNPFFGDTFRYSLQGLGLIVLFSWTLHGNPYMNYILNLRFFQMIGRYSYTIYLIHVVMIMVVEQAMPHMTMFIVAPIAAVLTILYGAAMFHYVERPLGRLRHKLHREPAPDPTEPVNEMPALVSVVPRQQPI